MFTRFRHSYASAKSFCLGLSRLGKMVVPIMLLAIAGEVVCLATPTPHAYGVINPATLVNSTVSGGVRTCNYFKGSDGCATVAHQWIPTVNCTFPTGAECHQYEIDTHAAPGAYATEDPNWNNQCEQYTTQGYKRTFPTYIDSAQQCPNTESSVPLCSQTDWNQNRYTVCSFQPHTWPL